jgi:hypothetical protein
MYFTSKGRRAMGCRWSRAIVVDQGLRLTKMEQDHKYTIIDATTAQQDLNPSDVALKQ